MNKLLLCLLSMLIGAGASAQFQIGHTTITFNDPDRTGGVGSGGGPGRQIETEIYYPAVVGGDAVAVADGAFPVVVVGHGFLMTFDAYENLWQLLVPEGYIVAIPSTEGTFAASHGDFGLDIALVANRLRNLNTTEGSMFQNHVTPQAALTGHSMGGGAAVLAAQQGDFDAYVGFASAETNPSATAAAANVNVPALMFAADGDAVTPPNAHQVPIYNAFASTCKALVTILGGGHCYFANESGTCDLGELFVGGNITISRAEQQAIVNLHLIPWLAFWLKGQEAAYDEFATLLQESSAVTYELNCEAPVHITAQNQRELISLYPNPSVDEVRLQGLTEAADYQVFRPDGRMVSSGRMLMGSPVLEVSAWPAGYYLIRVQAASSVHLLRFMKVSAN